MQTEIWVTPSEAASLCNLSKRMIQFNCKKGLYQTKSLIDNGGRQYRILLASLPAEAQVKYFELSNGSRSLQAADASEPLDISQIPEYNRKIYYKRALILQESEGLTGNNLKLWVAKWNAENPQYKTDYRQICAWRNMVKKEGEIALIGKLGNRKSDFKSPDELQEEYNNIIPERKQAHARGLLRNHSRLGLPARSQNPGHHRIQKPA